MLPLLLGLALGQETPAELEARLLGPDPSLARSGPMGPSSGPIHAPPASAPAAGKPGAVASGTAPVAAPAPLPPPSATSSLGFSPWWSVPVLALALGWGWSQRRRTEQVEAHAMRVLGRTVVGKDAAVVLLEVRDAGGDWRRLLVGHGAQGPQLITGLGSARLPGTSPVAASTAHPAVPSAPLAQVLPVHGSQGGAVASQGVSPSSSPGGRSAVSSVPQPEAPPLPRPGPLGSPSGGAPGAPSMAQRARRAFAAVLDREAHALSERPAWEGGREPLDSLPEVPAYPVSEASPRSVVTSWSREEADEEADRSPRPVLGPAGALAAAIHGRVSRGPAIRTDPPPARPKLEPETSRPRRTAQEGLELLAEVRRAKGRVGTKVQAYG